MLIFISSDHIRKATIFLDDQSCVQCSLKKHNDEIFLISYALEYINVKHAKLRIDYEMITFFPSLRSSIE